MKEKNKKRITVKYYDVMRRKREKKKKRKKREKREKNRKEHVKRKFKTKRRVVLVGNVGSRHVATFSSGMRERTHHTYI